MATDYGVQTEWLASAPPPGAVQAWTREYRMANTKIRAHIVLLDDDRGKTYHALINISGGEMAQVGDYRRSWAGAKALADKAAERLREIEAAAGDGGAVFIHAPPRRVFSAPYPKPDIDIDID